MTPTLTSGATVDVNGVLRRGDTTHGWSVLAGAIAASADAGPRLPLRFGLLAGPERRDERGEA